MDDLILSSSSLKLFRACRKAYELGYVRNLNPTGTESEAVENGTAIHGYLERAAKGDFEWEDLGSADTNAAVALDYLRHNPLPPDILMVEDRTFFVPCTFKAWVRCTFDLVYEEGGYIVLRDYKTFSRKPSLNLDLDFQGRFYIAAAQLYFKKPVRFEYVMIRQTPPNVPKDKAGTSWEPHECYFTYPLEISQREANDVWGEACATVRDIRYATRQGQRTKSIWYRNDRKGFGGCDSCFYRQLCAAENQLGALDQDLIDTLSTPRAPLVLPERYSNV